MALRKAAEDLRLLFLKPVCPGCGAERVRGELLCGWCSIRIEPCMTSRWSASGEPVSMDDAGRWPDPGDPRGVQVHPALMYSGVASEMVVRLKFSGERYLARTAASLIRDFSPVVPGPGDLLVPVPASRRTVRERGYNQARLISRALSSLTGARHMDLLERRAGPSQIGLPVAARRTNVQGVFRLRRGLRGHAGTSARIFLVDDVATTCSTLHSAAGVLLEGLGGSVAGLSLTYRSRDAGSMVR